jgi:EpsI family protein
MLLIAYLGVQTSARRIHQPTGCYPSNGFTVSNLRDARWPVMDGLTVPGRSFTAVRDDRVEHVGYWQRIGEHFPVTRMDERMALVVGAFQGVLSDSLLVRMSVITTDAAAARSIIAAFATALVRSCDPVARTLLIGPLSSGATRPAASTPAPHRPRSPAA